MQQHIDNIETTSYHDRYLFVLPQLKKILRNIIIHVIAWLIMFVLKDVWSGFIWIGRIILFFGIIELIPLVVRCHYIITGRDLKFRIN